MSIYTAEYICNLHALASHAQLDELSSSTVLVTGAGGLVGSHIVDVLLAANRSQDANIRIIASGRSKNKLLHRFSCPEIGAPELLEWDISDPFPGDLHVDFAIHAASNADPSFKSKQPVETFLNNIMGTKALLDLLKRQGAGRLVYVSSGEFYGEFSQDTAGTPEEYCGFLDYDNPSSCYGSSKRASEMLCRCYASEYGIDSVIARLCHTFGPGMKIEDPRALSAFLLEGARGNAITMNSAGAMKRSHCYSGDAATAILTIAASGKCAEAYNIADPNGSCTIRDFAEKVARRAEVGIVIKLADANQRASYQQSSNAILNPNKLIQLGWTPASSLEEGIDITLGCLRSKLISDRVETRNAGN